MKWHTQPAAGLWWVFLYNATAAGNVKVDAQHQAPMRWPSTWWPQQRRRPGVIYLFGCPWCASGGTRNNTSTMSECYSKRKKKKTLDTTILRHRLFSVLVLDRQQGTGASATTRVEWRPRPGWEAVKGHQITSRCSCWWPQIWGRHKPHHLLPTFLCCCYRVDAALVSFVCSAIHKYCVKSARKAVGAVLACQRRRREHTDALPIVQYPPLKCNPRWLLKRRESF